MTIVTAHTAQLTVQSTQVTIKRLQIITEVYIPRLHTQIQILILIPSTTIMYLTFTVHQDPHLLRVHQVELPQGPVIVQTLLVQFPASPHNLSIQIVIVNNLFLQLLIMVPLQVAFQALQVAQAQETLPVLQVLQDLQDLILQIM